MDTYYIPLETVPLLVFTPNQCRLICHSMAFTAICDCLEKSGLIAYFKVSRKVGFKYLKCYTVARQCLQLCVTIFHIFYKWVVVGVVGGQEFNGRKLIRKAKG